MIRLTPFALATLLPVVAIAASMDDDTPPQASETTQQCTDGKIWDAEAKACVNADQSSLSDDTLFDAVRELAYHKQPEAALTVLDAMSNQTEPRVLNMRGFALRKAGQMEAAMESYLAALEADPNYLLARSYMGQALAELGQLDAARDQLLEIRARGGRDTWAYASLKQALGGQFSAY